MSEGKRKIKKKPSERASRIDTKIERKRRNDEK